MSSLTISGEFHRLFATTFDQIASYCNALEANRGQLTVHFTLYHCSYEHRQDVICQQYGELVFVKADPPTTWKEDRKDVEAVSVKGNEIRPYLQSGFGDGVIWV